MANLTETSTFEAGIYQIETTDNIEGGALGISNLQGKQLGNRTRFLLNAINTLTTNDLAGRIEMFGGAFGGSDGKRPKDRNTGVANQGWVICDGTNGTPDLRDRFIVGAGASYGIGATGGEASHTLTIAEMPSHAHNYSFPSAGSGNYGGNGSGVTTLQSSSVGGNAAHNNLPPFYALAYIMKV